MTWANKSCGNARLVSWTSAWVALLLASPHSAVLSCVWCQHGSLLALVFHPIPQFDMPNLRILRHKTSNEITLPVLKKFLGCSTCVLGCKILTMSVVTQCLLVFSLSNSCPWGPATAIPQLWFVGSHRSWTQLVTTSLLPLQTFHQGHEWVRYTWGWDPPVVQKVWKLFSKLCPIKEKISYFEMLGLLDLLQINLTMLVSEISLLSPRPGPKNRVHSCLETMFCHISKRWICGPISVIALHMIVSVVT